MRECRIEVPVGWAKERARDFLLRFTWGMFSLEEGWGKGGKNVRIDSMRFRRETGALRRQCRVHLVGPRIVCRRLGWDVRS